MTKSELIEQLENLIEDKENLSGKDAVSKLIEEFCQTENDGLKDFLSDWKQQTGSRLESLLYDEVDDNFIAAFEFGAE